MAITHQKLRAKIVEKYGNQAKFAQKLNTSEITVSKKLCEKVPFTHKDIVKWCEILDISQDDIGSYFFA